LYFNLIGGGQHAKNSLPFQEYILVTKFDSPVVGLEYAELMVEKLKADISENFGEVRVGDETLAWLLMLQDQLFLQTENIKSEKKFSIQRKCLIFIRI